MATFHWSEEHVSEVINGAQGWVYYSWAVLNRATVFGTGLEMSSPGYIAKERERLKSIK